MGEIPAKTPTEHHIRRVTEHLLTGEWYLSIQHPDPAQGTVHLDRYAAQQIGQALADRATRAARTEGVGVTVMALEWTANKVAYTTGGVLYHIAVQGGTWVLAKLEYSSTTKSGWPDEDAAKAAAQADYEQRIKSALATPATDEARRQAAENAELRAALAGIADFAQTQKMGLPEGGTGWVRLQRIVDRAWAALRARAEEAGRAPVEGA